MLDYRLYYQRQPTRLPTCPLTIHALLHIADGIEACGPVWAYWAFPMERYCGLLQRAVLHSRRHPYVTLDKFIAEDAMLSQLKMRYNLYSELSLQPQKSEERGYQVPTCELECFPVTKADIHHFLLLRTYRSNMCSFTSAFNYTTPKC